VEPDPTERAAQEGICLARRPGRVEKCGLLLLLDRGRRPSAQVFAMSAIG